MSVIGSETKIKYVLPNQAVETLIHRFRVSSTLDKSTPRKSLIDRDSGTCWTSMQGLPQWIQLSFPNRVVPERLSVTFQGGFVGTRVGIYLPVSFASREEKKLDWVLLKHVYPEDINRKQQFDLIPSIASHSESSTQIDEDSKSVDGETLRQEGAQHIKLVFETSSDFFGRITIYDLDIFGRVKTAE